LVHLFRGIFFKALFQGAKERDALADIAFIPVSLFVYEDDHPSLPISGALPEHQAT